MTAHEARRILETWQFVDDTQAGVIIRIPVFPGEYDEFREIIRNSLLLSGDMETTKTVERAHWIHDTTATDDNLWDGYILSSCVCSNCGMRVFQSSRYCPDCGRMMVDGGGPW